MSFSTATSPIRNHLATDEQVGEEPMPRLDAGANLAARKKMVKGEGRKIIFASEIVGVKNGLE